MNKYQKVINQIAKEEKKVPLINKISFRNRRAMLRKCVRDLDFDELVIYKNLG